MANRYPPARMNQGHPMPVSQPISQPHYLRRDDSKEYRLVVAQQPVRARMCGFGDKDRRPITPPPCVKLVVIDRVTGREIDFNDIDSTYYVLQADLWNVQESAPVNTVRHSSAAPTVSISSSTVTSFPPPPERSHYLAAAIPQYDPQSQYRQDQLRQPISSQNMVPSVIPPPGMAPQAMTQYGQAPMPQTYYPQAGVYPTQPQPQYTNSYAMPQHTIVQASPTGSQQTTKNLIGMLSVNACRLNDIEGKPGFWFILQDLSVRTEGTFRLKLNLFDIGAGSGTNGVVERAGPTRGKGPCLAYTFSEPFTVYSAKKFPGVIESTPLSKCFAQQGIKIPIRKDGPKLPNQSEYDADD